MSSLSEGRAPAPSREASCPMGGVNVGEAERWASGIGGSFLIAAGLRRGSFGGLALAALGGSLLYRAATGHCHAYDALGINTADETKGGSDEHVHKGRLVKHSVIVDRPVGELYRAWRDVENLPRFMVDVESVRRTGEGRAHWVTRGPMGQVSEWDTEVFRDVPDHLIAWKTLPGAEVVHAGAVRFEPEAGGRGVRVTLEVNYEPPSGAIGMALAKMIGKDPDHSVREDLRRFKQWMEAGEIATVEGQSSGRA